METLHAKSPCCQGIVYRFGSRRRQCRACGRTWRIRIKKRGRKLKRSTIRLPERVFRQRARIASWAHRQHLSIAAASFRLRGAMKQALHVTQHRTFPVGHYALLGDGLYFKFKRREWVMYLMAVKPTHSSKAHFLDPVLLEGRECYERWTQAVATIPPKVKRYIRAFVSDGFRGSQFLSEQNHWLHQRCHFHLLAALVRGKGRRRYRVRGSRVRDRMLEATKILLSSREADTLTHARRTIRTLVKNPLCPPYIRKQAAEFLEREQDFRTYLDYPKLNLPTTTSAMESAGNLVRQAASTARTSKSVLLRATTSLRLRKSITCNGKSSTKLP